jgi:uncharacterized OsmC-like protein
VVEFGEEFRERMRKRLEFYRAAELQDLRRELAVSLVKHDNQLSEAWLEGGDVHWFSDEPKAHGGSGRGVSPLAYFLSSLGLCQLVHYAEHAAAEDMPITSLKMTVKGSFSLARPRSFEEIDYEVDIESPASPELIARLARQAAEDCFVTNTLKKACKVKGYVTHNGFKLLEL